ncbi:MAG: GWxTD domain-containing protein [candidate division KSB1 bacterium]|jgi:GWxTD domain-containing protein|nr:GWxTD domain-containing protein [candidate division KSB1 bacterium]
MKSVIYIAIAVFLFSDLSAAPKNKKQLAYACYQEGVKYYKADDEDAALKKFREAVEYDKKLAKAYEYIALILMDRGTVHSRFMATTELDKALKLDWHNPEFRFTNAKLYLKKDMDGAAMREFEKVVKYDPDNYMAYYQMGLIKEKRVMRYRDMIDADEGGVIYFRKYAEKDKDKTIYYYNKARAINPKFMDVYYRLGLLYYEFGEINEMIDLLSAAVRINSEDVNCHLFLGFAFHNDQQYANAEKYYHRAMELMPADQRRLFESIENIITTADRSKYEEMQQEGKRAMERAHWKRNDPFFLTEFNERRLEHYSRIAYVNLRYSKPEKKIEGWKTDQGKVYIRYGKPMMMYRTRPEIGDFSAINSFSPLKTSKDVWIYDDFEFIFDDQFLSNRYDFAWGDSPENDYRSVYELLIEKTPELHRYLPENKILEIATQLTEFKGERDSSALDVSYAVHADSLYLGRYEDRWESRLSKGMFIFDRHWNEIQSRKNEVVFPENDIIDIGESRYFIASDGISLEPGTYHLAFELLDSESGRRGSVRKEVEIKRHAPDSLALSDILLARSIEADSTAYTFFRETLDIVPNPLKRFSPGEPVYIYYEIYNLAQDASGMSRFRIEYTLGDGDEDGPGLFVRFLSKLNIVDIRGDVTTTLIYEGNSSREFLYQKIDLPDDLDGDVALTVQITDLQSDESVSRKSEFRLD